MKSQNQERRLVNLTRKVDRAHTKEWEDYCKAREIYYKAWEDYDKAWKVYSKKMGRKNDRT